MLSLSNPFLECNFQDNIFIRNNADKRYKCPFSIKAFAVFFHELIIHCQNIFPSINVNYSFLDFILSSPTFQTVTPLKKLYFLSDI